MELDIQGTKILNRLYESNSRIIISVGGARSSKSYSFAQYLLTKLVTQPEAKILITRKTLPSLRLTAYSLFIDLLKKHGLYREEFHNKSIPIAYRYPFTQSVVYFVSIDDPERIKSTDFNYIWLEEANEFTWNDYRLLLLRLSNPKPPDATNQILLSLNPSNESSWIHKKLENDPEAEIIKSTYKDNPFLDEEYIKLLESLQHTDEVAWKIYGLGEWATPEGLIYTNMQKATLPKSQLEEIFRTKDPAYGLDFGYNNPTALILAARRENELFLKQLIYESGLTNADLIKRMDSLGISKSIPIYADSAEPDRIEEIKRAGYNIHPCEKKSVPGGIDVVKKYRIFYTEESEDIEVEAKTYKWAMDKDGNYLDRPVQKNDHAMDAIRYIVTTHYEVPESFVVYGDGGDMQGVQIEEEEMFY